MEKDFRSGKDDFLDDMEGRPEELVRGNPHAAPRRTKHVASGMWFLVAGGICVVLLVGLVFGLYRGDTPLTAQDLAPLNTRLDQLDNKLRKFEEAEERIAYLEKELSAMRKSMDKAAETQKAAREAAAAAEKSKAPEAKPAAAKPPAKPAAKSPTPPEKPTVDKKAQSHKVAAGDTLYSISRKYGLTVERLCQLNKIDPKNPKLTTGQSVIVSSGAN